jgi:hypothetical protein
MTAKKQIKGCKCCEYGHQFRFRNLCEACQGHTTTPPQEPQEQDAVCTEHGREGCSHKFPQEPVLLFECENCKQWVRAKVVTFIDGKYAIENHECVPQEPRSVAHNSECLCLDCKSCHPMCPVCVPQGESMEERLAQQFTKHGAITALPPYWLEAFIRTELSRERLDAIQALQEKKDSEEVQDMRLSKNEVIDMCVALLSERKGQ